MEKIGYVFSFLILIGQILLVFRNQLFPDKSQQFYLKPSPLPHPYPAKVIYKYGGKRKKEKTYCNCIGAGL